MKILQHLTALVLITLIMGLIYTAVQQTYRSNANDPQTQMVLDLGRKIELGQSLSTLLPDTVDLRQSLAVFAVTYDQQGTPIQGNALLDGKLPRLPAGLLEQARLHGADWVTWQPKEEVRMALGVVKLKGTPAAYLAVGRSLREVEQRVSRLVNMVIIAWILCCAVVLVSWIVSYLGYRKQKPALA